MLLFSWYKSVANSLTCYIYVCVSSFVFCYPLIAPHTSILSHWVTPALLNTSFILSEDNAQTTPFHAYILFTWSKQLFQECTSSPGLENVCPWDSQNEGVTIVNTSDCPSFPWTETTRITDSLPTVVLVLICDCLHIPAACEGHMQFSMTHHTLL